MVRKENKPRIRTGIIGGGKIIRQSVQAMREQGDLDPVAICSRRESWRRTGELAAACEIPEVYPDAEELLSGAGVDAVYVAVSNEAHYAVARKVLEAGKHVLVEKPFCASYVQAEELFALAERKGLLCFEAAPIRFAPVITQVKNWLPQIGRIRVIQTNYSQFSSRYEQFCAGETPAVFDPQRAGGALMDLGIYQVYLLLSLFGMPESFRYSANMVRGVDTSGVLEMRYPDFLCSSITTKDCDGISGFQIQGEEGYITSDCRPNDITRAELHLRSGETAVFDEERKGHRFIHEMAAFSELFFHNDLEACKKLAQGSLDSLKILDRCRAQMT